jgi:hypothetical protein
LKPDPVLRVDLEGWNRTGLKKKEIKEKPGVTRLTWQVDPMTRQDPIKNLITTR